MCVKEGYVFKEISLESGNILGQNLLQVFEVENENMQIRLEKFVYERRK